MPILQTFPGTARKPELFDHPGEIDAVAESTEWTAMISGGGAIRTHRIRGDGFKRLEYRATWGFRLIVLGFGLFGLIPLYAVHKSREWPHPAVLIFLILIAIFAMVLSLWVYRRGSRPAVFDKPSGLFWRGHGSPADMDAVDSREKARLKDIHAIQVVPGMTQIRTGKFLSYYIHLVLKDGSRRYLYTHSRKTAIDYDTSLLSGFLEVPVWEWIPDEA